MIPERIFPAIVESMPDAVVIVDRSGNIELVNAQAEALFGYERDEMVGHPVEMLLPDELRVSHLSHRSRYAQQPGTRPMGIGLELRGQRKDGSHFPVEISLSPLQRGERLFVTAVVRDVTERIRLRSELQIERERQRIAMDLHDETIQSIYAVGLGLELAMGDLMHDPAHAAKRIDRSVEQLDTAINGIRSYIFDLRPLHTGGDLAQDLLAMLEEFRASSQMRVETCVSEDVPRIRHERAAAMLNIAREALSNARRHSGAEEVQVTLASTDERIELEIRDDGRGFDTSTSPPSAHLGVRNMRARMQQLPGELQIESAPGAGTRIRVTMPIDA